MRCVQILRIDERTPASRAGARTGPVPGRAAAAALAGVGSLVLTLGLAACGSGGSTSANAPAPPAQTSEAAAPVGSAGLTPPGAHLSLGQKALVGWVPPGTSDGPGDHKGYRLQVTVESIEKGTIADFKNVNLKASEKSSTPYHVKVRIKALAKTAPSGVTDPDVTFDAIDDRGQKQAGITFLGTFSRCDDKLPPKPFADGKTYETCLAYLMPGGGSIQKVQWNNGPFKGDGVSPYFEKPIEWSGS
jgi:hypothetical protein